MIPCHSCHIFVSIPIMRFMRFFVILAAMVTPVFAWAQDAKIAELQQQVNRLESILWKSGRILIQLLKFKMREQI